MILVALREVDCEGRGLSTGFVKGFLNAVSLNLKRLFLLHKHSNRYTKHFPVFDNGQGTARIIHLKFIRNEPVNSRDLK